MTAKILNKRPHGQFDYKYDNQNGIFVVTWNDKFVVTLGVNCIGSTPVQSTRKWPRHEKKKVDVPQSQIMTAYNTNMAEFVRLDQKTSIGTGCRLERRRDSDHYPLFPACSHSLQLARWLYTFSLANNRKTQTFQIFAMKSAKCIFYDILQISASKCYCRCGYRGNICQLYEILRRIPRRSAI